MTIGEKIKSQMPLVSKDTTQINLVIRENGFTKVISAGSIQKLLELPEMEPFLERSYVSCGGIYMIKPNEEEILFDLT